VQFSRDSLLGDGEVVLTFDDGPLRPFTQGVLDALAAHCTKATFFAVGRRALADPEMVQEVLRQGHTVGTHTWSHRNSRTLTPAHARAEIDLGVSAVRKAAAAPIAPFFRFPYLVDTPETVGLLHTRNLAAFSIDIDPFDYLTRDPARVHRDVIRKLAAKGKGIILLHDVQPSTASALKTILDDMKARGFRVVHLVAKQPAETVALYDAFVAQPLTDATRHFLDQRSTYWPLTREGELMTAQGSQRAPARPGVRGTGTSSPKWPWGGFSP
jgi:peptidoglycan-N-acetylglucosamine deacetylase